MINDKVHLFLEIIICLRLENEVNSVKGLLKL